MASERRDQEREPARLQETEPDDLGMTIDRDGDVPIGVQLAWALRMRIHEGQFEPGQRLPGLRDLAHAVGVNVNTARAVYQRLEQEGLIETRQGNGTFVADCSQEPSQVGLIAAGAARRARQVGVDPREVAAVLYVSSRPENETEQLAVARRAMLRTQITALETALGEIESAYPGVAPAPEITASAPAPRLLDGTELERVRADLVRRLATVQAAIDALVGDEPAAPTPKPQRGRSVVRKQTQKRAINPAPAGA